MTFAVKIRVKKPTEIGEVVVPPAQDRAEALAYDRHGNQPHGCLLITDHLKDVTNHVGLHYDPAVNILDLDDVVAAAWLHDIIEDTPTEIDEIEDLFGTEIASVVNLLTDKAGYNRLERHLRTYHAIRTDPDATLIKLCDRRHNQSRSLDNGEHWMAMYAKEYTYFKFALWTPNKFKKLWDELDWQYEEMIKKLTW